MRKDRVNERNRLLFFCEHSFELLKATNKDNLAVNDTDYIRYLSTKIIRYIDDYSK